MSIACPSASLFGRLVICISVNPRQKFGTVCEGSRHTPYAVTLNPMLPSGFKAICASYGKQSMSTNMPRASNCVSPVYYILAQTEGKIYQFLVIAPIRSDKNMVINESQICVDKARLQRYNEHIRNYKSLYCK